MNGGGGGGERVIKSQYDAEEIDREQLRSVGANNS